MIKNNIRKNVYTINKIEELIKDIVLNNLNNKKRDIKDFIIDGDNIYILSDRYKIFFTKGYECSKCGIKGEFFAKEKSVNQERYHLNLYAIDKNNKEVLICKGYRDIKDLKYVVEKLECNGNCR